MRSSLNASKDNGVGVADLAPYCVPEPVMDAVKKLQWSGSACSGVLEAGSDREETPSDVCFVGDTRQSLSAKDDDSILHMHHLFRIVSHRNMNVDWVQFMRISACEREALDRLHGVAELFIGGMSEVRR